MKDSVDESVDELGREIVAPGSFQANARRAVGAAALPCILLLYQCKQGFAPFGQAEEFMALVLDLRLQSEPKGVGADPREDEPLSFTEPSR